MYLVTTSHRPSQRIRSFAKDLASTLPQGRRVNRGKSTLYDLLLDAVEHGDKRIIIVAGRRGNPSLLRIYRVDPYAPNGPELRHTTSIVISGVSLSREVRGFTRVYNPSSLVVRAARGAEEFAELIARGLGVPLVMGETEADVVLEVRHGPRGFIILFLGGVHNRVCGPIIRAQRIIDHEQGIRVPPLEAWRGGREPGQGPETRSREPPRG